MAAHVVVFITASSTDEGRAIASAVVEARLAACVNVISPIESVYRWQGQVRAEPEVLLMAKTTGELLDRLASKVKELHSYEVPEIVALPIVAGAESYLRWIDKQTGPSDEATARKIQVQGAR